MQLFSFSFCYFLVFLELDPDGEDVCPGRTWPVGRSVVARSEGKRRRKMDSLLTYTQIHDYYYMAHIYRLPA
jgi:hypothetical protein